MYQTLSAALIVAVTVGLSAYDLLPALNDTPGDTLSAVIRQWSREWVVIPYVWGVLGGHFFAGHEHAMTTPAGDFYVTLWSMWLMLIVSLSLRSAGVDVPTWGYAALMLVGVFVGHLFWSQA